MTRSKLPIGIQTLRRMREEGAYYVDKTPYAVRLVEQGSYIFCRARAALARACSSIGPT
jgi:hypothetical protein